MRAQLLVNVLNDYAKSGSFEIREQVQSEEEETYFIIHPILKSIATLAPKIEKDLQSTFQQGLLG